VTASEATGVGFDVDHTIAIDNKLERVAFLHLLELIGDERGSECGNLNDEIARIDELLVLQRGGEFSIDEAVCRFARAHGVARDEFYIERFRTTALQMVDEFVVPLPGAKRAFEALRGAGVRSAVLSNGWNPLQLRKARRAGFDGPVLASSQLGTQKPDARAFAALTAELGSPASLTWYVGDDPRCDVEGARAAGLRGVWLDAEGRAFPPDLAPPAFAVHALDEVPGLVLSGSRVA
jgi:HAD superfamily hydrolase (TIGR01549 family)